MHIDYDIFVQLVRRWVSNDFLHMLSFRTSTCLLLACNLALSAGEYDIRNLDNNTYLLGSSLHIIYQRGSCFDAHMCVSQHSIYLTASPAKFQLICTQLQCINVGPLILVGFLKTLLC